MNHGEGSRGGHIVGHTKTGKAVYGDHKDTAKKVDAGKSLAHSSWKNGFRATSIVGGVISGLASKHLELGLKFTGRSSRGAAAAVRRSLPLSLTGLGLEIAGAISAGRSAINESKDQGGSEDDQKWAETKENFINLGLSYGASRGTGAAYNQLKKVGPDIRQGASSGIKAAKYGTAKATQYAMRATRGIRNYAKFIKAKPFVTEAFTAATRLLIHKG